MQCTADLWHTSPFTTPIWRLQILIVSCGRMLPVRLNHTARTTFRTVKVCDHFSLSSSRGAFRKVMQRLPEFSCAAQLPGDNSVHNCRPNALKRRLPCLSNTCLF